MPIKYSWMLLKFKFNHYLSKQLPWIKNCHKSSFHALRRRMYQIIKKLFWITGWRAWWISINVFFNTWLVKHLTVLIIVSLWSFFTSQNFNTVCRQWLLPSCIFVLKMLKSKILLSTSCVNNLFTLGLHIIKSKYTIFQVDLLKFLLNTSWSLDPDERARCSSVQKIFSSRYLLMKCFNFVSKFHRSSFTR